MAETVSSAMLEPIVPSTKPHAFATRSIAVFKVAPGDTLCFKLVFRPLRPGEHSFQLPLSLEGIPPDGSKHLRVPVSAAGLRPTLTFTSTEVDFGRRVVSRDPCGLNQYQGEFLLRNASDKVSQGGIIRVRAFGSPTRHGNRYFCFFARVIFLGNASNKVMQGRIIRKRTFCFPMAVVVVSLLRGCLFRGTHQAR